MNYRHAFHAGNHADVLKHVVLLSVCDALTVKPAPCFALDTHAGGGLYRLDAAQALRSGESAGGIARLTGADNLLLRRYLHAVDACRAIHGPDAYPGSPWLLAHTLRAQDRAACCELQPQEAQALTHLFANDPRVAVHARDGYGALRALLPPRAGETKFARGLVLIDPPYELQLQEFDLALAALTEGLTRWPQATYLLWYPIKQRRASQPFYRNAAALAAKATLRCELLVRPDNSPLRMNGSGLLILNPPWQIEQSIAPALDQLGAVLGETGASTRLDWLQCPA